jgi:hypothetical protein
LALRQGRARLCTGTECPTVHAIVGVVGMMRVSHISTSGVIDNLCVTTHEEVCEMTCWICDENPSTCD